MTSLAVSTAQPVIVLPNVGALALSARHAAWLTPDGEIESLTPAEAATRAGEGAIVCHRGSVARRLGLDRFPAFDLLDLFAFTYPARFCLPTVRGLASWLGLAAPKDLAGECVAIVDIARRLLLDLAQGRADARSDAAALADTMRRAGWAWGDAAMAALGGAPAVPNPRNGYDVWRRLPEWEDEAPRGAPGQMPVTPNEARRRLAEMVAVERGSPAEPRPQQADFASAITGAFGPRESPDGANAVIAEAGTGVGKTLGYLAPATLWAERNKAPVWVSTYTRNLQHQIDEEMERRFTDPEEKARRVVVRKGRENYLCLLNFADAARGASAQPGGVVGVGLMARWVAATRDGDLTGGDFPGWLAELHGRGRTFGLADRRGECVYSACEHYRRCFIEHNVRRARQADIVIANHALVMVQAALGGIEDAYLPTRYVFDEGHHLFDAADSAFAAHLTARETVELRRWLIGADTAQRSRARGLKRRIEDLAAGDEAMLTLLDRINEAARALPGEGWRQRLTGEPHGPAERFLFALRGQVYARAEGQHGLYSLETEPRPAAAEVLGAAADLDAALAMLEKPIAALTRKLKERLEADADTLSPEDRRRLDAMARGLNRRGTLTLAAWRGMLASLTAETAPEFVDWFGVERADGHDVDFGYYRRHVDPTVPFAATIGAQAHGLAITSATLTDGTGDVNEDWAAAAEITGSRHFARPAMRAQVPSPFDYAAHTRVFVVTDVRKDDLDQVAAAYRALFLAAGGGALGLFTAVQRLKGVHERIADALETAGLPLFAQHLDGLDVSTLVEIFRAEEDACLLGTDAVRDGVDVPGRALRLIVFDRVPWPRPDILHKARRQSFGGKKWDERLTRRRLRQAYGRLIRRADDTGVFVLLDPMMPSRLSGAFPAGVVVNRVGLAEAVAETSRFLGESAGRAERGELER
jgi:ATP-dependent DNA helicase DinG